MTGNNSGKPSKSSNGGGADGKLHEGEMFLQHVGGAQPSIEEDIKQFFRPYMPEQHREFFTSQFFLFLGSMDEFHMPTASLVLGSPGLLARSPSNRELVIQTNIHPGDPLKKNLALGSYIGLLGLEFWTRRRNRMNGKITGMFEPTDSYSDSFRLGVDLSFGNCPKYIVRRVPLINITGAGQQLLTSKFRPASKHDTSTELLTDEQQAIIDRSDTFFIASAYIPDDTPAAGVDINHRGGRPGFVEVSSDGKTIKFPDYIGNFFFNTLGNLYKNPKCGLLFVDFESGDTLQVNGTAKILFTERKQPGAQRTVEVNVSRVLHHKQFLPFGWEFVDLSPYSPDVIEKEGGKRPQSQQRREKVKCIDIIEETHDVKTFLFQTRPTTAKDSLLMHCTPGQYATFEVDMGEKRTDADAEAVESSEEQSPVRTWTVSENPRYPEADEGEEASDGVSIVFGISVKRKLGGLVSPFLHDHLQKGSSLILTGVGGSFTMESILSRRPDTCKSLMIAAGSGITPFISILRGLAAAVSPPVRSCKDLSLSPTELKHRLTDLDIVLVFSTKTKQDLIYQRELLSLEQNFPRNFRLICTITQATSSNNVSVPTDTELEEQEQRPRFLQGRISKQTFATEVPDLLSRTVAICGPQGFTDGVQLALVQLGFSSDHVITESYDF